MGETNLIGKVTFAMILYALGTDVVVFGLALNVNLLFWGAVGQIFALIANWKKLETEVENIGSIMGVLRFGAGLIKGAVLAVMTAGKIAAWIASPHLSEYLVAFFIGALVDLIWPILTEGIKKYASEKVNI